MKRNLFAVAAASLVLATGAAFAQSSVDVDPYWKAPVGPKVEQTQYQGAAKAGNDGFRNSDSNNP